MKRVLLACGVALAGVFVAAPAQAQIAGAIGKPLPSPDLAKGTVSVRIVAGSPSSPVAGTEVTLVVNGATRIARTDSAGRAFFKDLPLDATFQAKVTDEDKKECPTCKSDEFSLPADSGVRLMLSTRPWNPGAGGGPMAGGAMPNPRAMSGEPRPESNDKPGMITVRLSYDDFKDAPPVDVPVVLVGYAADGSVTTQVVKSDKEGRAQFTSLDRTGATSYFAMTQLPRNGATDRLTSTPIILDPRSGVRMILSSEKRASTAAPIDDLSKLERQEDAGPAGKVRVALEGGPDLNAVVKLIDPQQKITVATAKPTTAPPDVSDVQVQADFNNKTDIAAGTLRVKVHGGAQDDAPLAGVNVRLVDSATPETVVANELVTDATGTLELKSMSQELVTAVVIVNGKELSSKPLDLTKTGGEVELTARWPSEGKPEVVFDLVPRPGQVVYAETTMHGQSYRSLPFQPVPERASRVSLFILPRVLFSFILTAWVDDEYFAVSGKFDISNNSWLPYVGGSDGIIVPLPKGFSGGQVAEKDQGDVAMAQGEGFRIGRPIAPGQRTFHGAFSLPIEDGEAHWNMDLPLGAWNSEMQIRRAEGMQVRAPAGARVEPVDAAQGSFFVIPISILPKQSMVMSVAGLPSPPAWRVWLPRLIGIVVVLLIIGGVAFALDRSKVDHASTAQREERRQKLLEELVDLEKSGKNEKRREQIMAELEKLWTEMERGGSTPTRGTDAA